MSSQDYSEPVEKPPYPAVGKQEALHLHLGASNSVAPALPVAVRPPISTKLCTHIEDACPIFALPNFFRSAPGAPEIFAKIARLWFSVYNSLGSAQNDTKFETFS